MREPKVGAFPPSGGRPRERFGRVRQGPEVQARGDAVARAAGHRAQRAFGARVQGLVQEAVAADLATR